VADFARMRNRVMEENRGLARRRHDAKRDRFAKRRSRAVDVQSS
jgi:hypothetical protein